MNYTKQFEFEHWSNGLILESLQKLNAPNEKAINLFSHLLSSHCMWLSRLNKTPFTTTLFQTRTLAECEALMQENLLGWKTYLSNKTEIDLEQSIEFMAAWEANPSKRIMSIEDMIIHIINHSSYHRGQIVQLIKGQVDELPLSTYIIYASNIVTE
jgi:uncharacterized damage-inducible protein DinB